MGQKYRRWLGGQPRALIYIKRRFDRHRYHDVLLVKGGPHPPPSLQLNFALTTHQVHVGPVPAEAARRSSCFHCGLAVPAEKAWQINFEGTVRAVCCAGCEAIAQTIIGAGMGDYYLRRDKLPVPPVKGTTLPESLRSVLALPVMTDFVCSRTAAGQREAALLIDGLTCAACAWLAESRLRSLPGVVGADVNYSTRRARVRWDEQVTGLPQIVAAVDSVGYRAWPANPQSSAQLRIKESRDSLLRLAVAALGMMQVMMYAFPAYMARDGTLGADLEALMRGASLLLTLPVIFYSAAPFFLRAWRDVRVRRIGMDLPISIGVLVAFAASVVATVKGGGEVFFDSITMFIFLLLASRYLELRARHAAARTLDALSRALPAHAHAMPQYPAKMDVTTIPASALVAGTHVMVRPGEAFPADGLIVEGVSDADESLMTGEASPQRKEPGLTAIGGAVNLYQPLIVQVQRAGEATLLSHIVRLVEHAGNSRPQLQALVDRIAQWFLLGVLVLAAATAAYWMSVDPTRAASAAIAVLVVTCPCALSLAVPAALTAAASAAARDGLMVTRQGAIETLAKVTHVVFDKTGTLTRGEMRVRDVIQFAQTDCQACLNMAAAVEVGSQHTVAQAIIAAAAGPLPLVTHSVNYPGRGVEARVAGKTVRVGRAEFVMQLSGELPQCDWPGTPVWVGEQGCVLACVCLEDALKTGAAEAIDRLRARGLTVSILSGDSTLNVTEVARRLGISRYQAELTPDQKLQSVKEMQDRGEVVLMVGDGVNDAPVLAQAHVSMAMGAGAALAQSNADYVLLRNDLAAVDQGIFLARRTARVVRQNLAWAAIYNILAVPLAAGGLISPWIAGAGMAASSALVVANALRLAARTRRFAVPSENANVQVA